MLRPAPGAGALIRRFAPPSPGWEKRFPDSRRSASRSRSPAVIPSAIPTATVCNAPLPRFITPATPAMSRRMRPPTRLGPPSSSRRGTIRSPIIPSGLSRSRRAPAMPGREHGAADRDPLAALLQQHQHPRQRPEHGEGGSTIRKRDPARTGSAAQPPRRRGRRRRGRRGRRRRPDGRGAVAGRLSGEAAISQRMRCVRGGRRGMTSRDRYNRRRESPRSDCPSILDRSTKSPCSRELAVLT